MITLSVIGAVAVVTAGGFSHVGIKHVIGKSIKGSTSDILPLYCIG
jgi:hypothetical protein